MTADTDLQAADLAETHPCYCESACSRYGRVHLAVAPRCNLGCRYCERTVGERARGAAGPGTAEQILSPEEAAARVDELRGRWNLRVVGIAGPGEPLANTATLETLRLVNRAHPDLLLCLSTNGLELEGMLPELVAAGLRSLTVTINTTRPETAARLYAWAMIDDRRMVGPAAAGEILGRQWRGLAAAVKAGLLVKVNSILIPGLTENDLPEVARRAAELGAHRHNIMPLIPRGRMKDRRAPTAQELAEVQDRCQQWIAQFRGCTQCRADAVMPPSGEAGSCRVKGDGDRGGVSRRDFLRVAAGSAAAFVLSGCGLPSRLSRPKLVVWSCGGNYDLLLDFNRRFEELADCRVTYSSAPVEHLISVLSSRPRNVDILVGRSGPGWAELQEKGRLAGKPQVFSLDPYVIIVPPGNPGRIQGLEDLKRPDVKTVYSPTASGPSGKVVDILLETADRLVAPGIREGFIRNAIEAHDCGWKVFPPVAEGRAHASITRLSMTTAKETRGKVEAIPLPVKVMVGMKVGAIPQRVAPIAGSKHPELVAQYIEALRGDLGREVCEKHGYIHSLSSEAASHKALFKMKPAKSKVEGKGQSQNEKRGSEQ